MDTPLIEFKDVTKRFGGRTVLEQVNLQIYEGQVTTIIGLSGSGKSVLLKHIIGLLKPDEGTIFFRGKPLDRDEKEGNGGIPGSDQLHVSRQRAIRLHDYL